MGLALANLSEPKKQRSRIGLVGKHAPCLGSEGEVEEMWSGIMARLVARAIPPGVTDPDQERVAVEAAENGILSIFRFSVCIVAILLAAIGGLLYQGFLRHQIVPGPLQVATSQVGTDGEPVRRTEALPKNEDVQNKLDTLIRSQDTVQGKVSELERQVADLTTRLRESERFQTAADATGPAGASQSAKRAPSHIERRTEAKSQGDLKGEKPPAPGTYVCGDGRTVRDPVVCKRGARPTGGN